MLNGLFFKYLYPTKYLVKYYKQGCKTDEEIRFNNSIKISNKGINYVKYSIWVAIAIGATSIILTFITLFKPNNDTILILDRFEQLEQKTDRRFIELEMRLNNKMDAGFKKLERADSLINLRIDNFEKYKPNR